MPETEMSGLKELLKKRSTIKGRLTKFREYITVLNQIKPADLTGAQVKEISLRLTKFQELFTSFDELQDQIELLSTDQDEQIRERDFIESQFYSLISTAQEIIDSISQSRDRAEGSVNSKPSGTCSHALNTIKLPTIKLPNFDGNYLKWLEFRDTFDSLINSNDTIPTINKFHYLRSALEGSATVVIKSIEFTSANYRVAWDLLCERYNNKNILINNHLKALFNIEPITRESYKALRYLIDQVSKNLRALGTLGLPTEQWDVLVIFMMSSKLDINTNRKWEEYKGNLSDLPTLLEFKTFLRNRADVLETTQGTRSDKHTHDYKSNYKSQQSSKSLVAANTEVSKRIVCSICKKDHRVYLCPVFLEMSLEDRQSEVNKLKLCSNCLREGHNAHRCRLKGCCRSCKGKHNSLLHKEIAEVLKAAPVSLAIAGAKEVLLCTALVDIVNPQNNSCQRARILLDTGSQSCFMTTNFKNKMGLSVNRVKPVNVSGINNIGFDISERCYVQLNSRVSSFTAKLTCLIVPRITGSVPNNKIELQNLKLPLNIELADPAFYQPADIDILIGADVFWDIIGTQQIKLGQDKPTLLDSKLGWLVSGPVGKSTCNDNFMCNFNQLDIYESMKRFWEVEELPTTKNNLFSVEEQLCETHFVNNTSRLSNGRFSVKMPFKESPEDSLEYQELGHLSEVDRPSFAFYLPHHAVVREEKETTKVRVVFDASAKSSSGKSLNDIQLIEIDNSQRHLQLILWREDEEQPLKILKLNTVTYGMASAPHLATRCLLQLSQECNDETVANVIKRDFYMDDLSTGSNSVDELRKIYNGVTQTLESACFPLRKFRTNCSELFENQTDVCEVRDWNKQSSVLGLNWSPKSDTLFFSTDIPVDNVITKRTVTSMTCKIFDPLGLLSASIIKSKIFLQQLWSNKIDWDQPLPSDEAGKWTSFIQNLAQLSSIVIPRHVLKYTDCDIDLHCFVDASQHAYGATVVIEINDLTKEFAWMHVPTDQNPADLVSRGIDQQQLQDSTLWWRGPSFLAKEESEWPIQGSFATNNLPELKVFTCTKVDTKINNCSVVKFEKYSRYDKLKRIVAYVLRFINKCRKNAVSNDVIEPEELENSLMLLVKQAQLESFANELYTIAKDRSLPLKSKLLPLDPFIDTLGILRVGGRLQNSKFDFNKKHPILLDGKHHFSKILMRHEHFRLLHAGPQLLLAAVREEFWLIGGRNLARSVTRKCIVCARMRGQVIKPIMGTLPSVRVSSSFAFDTCGIDFAGPFLIASKKGRGSNITKCFLALFVCLQTKALHLETVSSMSSDAFLLCLRRFVSRRGRPQVIYCDNGTNFVGAKNELGRVLKASCQSVSDYASAEKIKFVFSPAYAPHFGGIWEAGIKSAKSHLKRVASNASLTFRELAALFTQIEAILNSRPLSPLSSDPTDLYPLTPGHFLIGRPLMSVPSLPVTTKRPNRYEFIEQLRQHFWERWRREFIAELQQRTKWRTRQRDLQIGDMVVLKEDQLPPLRWCLGRITRLYPGPDGINRVADIFTAKGTTRRAFNKICLLPTSPDA
ncbi:uncharacterized protein LOC123668590 [Melitaea cinxia]|uniref:uncharacterized protein LOC123668590 n=1 Tax=Melitaea cinxia TaxID=113334 RepID=UPI001E272B22|nr:uncharacterized protein LOC123668590 [Melitaea cinxia]